jgi:ATP-dependent protease Clp ATPase subunit
VQGSHLRLSEKERVTVEATVEERSRYTIINQSTRLNRMVLIGHRAMHRIKSCSVFNHYKHIKVNLKGFSRGETSDTTLRLN